MTDKNKGLMYGSLVIFVWGTSLISSKVLLGTLTPEKILFFRFSIGALFLSFIECRKHNIRTTLKRESGFFFLALLGGVGFYLLQTEALNYTNPSNVAIIGSMSPIVVMFLGFFMKKEKISLSFILGCLISITGIVILEIKGMTGGGSSDVLGLVLSFSSILAWSLYSILISGRFRKESCELITQRVFLYSALVLAVYLMVTGEFHFSWSEYDAVAWFNIAYLALIATVVCFLCWNCTVRIIGESKAMLSQFLIPLIALCTEAIVFRKSIHIYQIAGISIVLIGLFIILEYPILKDRRKRVCKDC